MDFRLDAEYYSKTNLRKEESVKKISHDALGSLCELVAGPFGSAITAENYAEDSKFRYIRAMDIKSFFLNNNAPVFVEENTYKNFPQFHLQEKDILLTVVGMNFGVPAIIQKEDGPAIFSCKSTLIRNPVINPYYLVTYLSSKVGHGLIRRGYRGAAQPGINLSDIENVLVPIMGDDFQNEIELITKLSRSFARKAQASYASAESFLLDILGMESFSVSSDTINVKSFKDSFAATGRLDAEYYQPKYEDYQAHILSYPHGWQPLIEVCNLNDINFAPDDSAAYKYIELADIDNVGCVIDCTVALGKELPSRARRLVSAGDVLISSVEGSLSSCAIVPKEMNGALCSTGFYVINSARITSETLLVLFKSPLVQNLLKQNCSGTILTAINKTGFQSIPVPIIDEGSQVKISNLVTESFAQKEESKRLLEVAKSAVEVAIECGEAAGLEFIKANL